MTYTSSARSVTKRFLSVFNRGTSVIIGFFSSFILTLLLGVQFQIDTLVILVESYVIFQIVTATIIAKIISVVPPNEAGQWHELINKVTDFVDMLGLFLATNFFLTVIESTFSMTDFSLLEVIATIYVIVLSLFTLAQVLYYLSSVPGENESDNDKEE